MRRRVAHIGETAKSRFSLGHANMENFVFQIARWARVLQWTPWFQSFWRMPKSQFRQPYMADQEICSGLLLHLSNSHWKDRGRMGDPSPAWPAWRIQRGLSSPKVVQHLEQCFPRLGEVALGHTRKWGLGRSCFPRCDPSRALWPIIPHCSDNEIHRKVQEGEKIWK